VGGTALALQYGHRQSVDLDFFGTLPEDIDAMEDELRSVGQLSILKSTKTIRLYQINGIKVDFVDYSRYPWIREAVNDNGLVLASAEDIAAMKVNAAEGRGTKKDFMDIYELLRHFSLREILSFYKAKYPEHSIFRALISLSYFDDADHQMPPVTFSLPDWETIKQEIQKVVNLYSE
jgi:predicted nucleotidyltransferase component of viral defense system